MHYCIVPVLSYQTYLWIPAWWRFLLEIYVVYYSTDVTSAAYSLGSSNIGLPIHMCRLEIPGLPYTDFFKTYYYS